MSVTVWTEMLRAIHANQHQVVMAITGGGSKAIGQLLEIPGASQTLLEAVVPYAPAALSAWLGNAPEQFCSVTTARAMAMRAWLQARKFSDMDDPLLLVGMGTTASLASNHPKRGTHRIHVAVQTATSTASSTLILTSKKRDRKKEEWLAAKLSIVMLGKVCGINTYPAEQTLNEQLEDNEHIEFCLQQAKPSWTELYLGQQKFATLPSPTSSLPKALFPGSFNPPHQGHLRIAEVASQITGQPVAYELSITNVDKLPLDYYELKRRYDLLQAIDHEAVLLITNAPTFRSKSELLPGTTFVVGADTMLRIANLRYYPENQTDYDTAIEQISNQGCRFLVFGRCIEGRFQVLSDLPLPDNLRILCDEVPAEQFREDISSHSLRQQAHQN